MVLRLVIGRAREGRLKEMAEQVNVFVAEDLSNEVPTNPDQACFLLAPKGGASLQVAIDLYSNFMTAGLHASVEEFLLEQRLG